jgi:hypothetical protein
LQVLGHRPLIVDLLAVRDDDHLLAVFQGGQPVGCDRQIELFGTAVSRAGLSHRCASCACPTSLTTTI